MLKEKSKERVRKWKKSSKWKNADRERKSYKKALAVLLTAVTISILPTL